jgi:hypothetical protein
VHTSALFLNADQIHGHDLYLFFEPLGIVSKALSARRAHLSCSSE